MPIQAPQPFPKLNIEVTPCFGMGPTISIAQCMRAYGLNSRAMPW